MVYSQSPGGLARVILILVLAAALTRAVAASAAAGEYAQFYSGLVKGISKAQGGLVNRCVNGLRRRPSPYRSSLADALR
jgi:hypothetical protein